nr:tRNA pseudouridine(38-40) synthase TruA [Planctomycetota bacterium]
MRSVRLWIAYDGTDYEGWQRQASGNTIQEEVEGAFRALVGEAVTVHGSGRTDAGVHELSQCAHVQIERGPPT